MQGVLKKMGWLASLAMISALAAILQMGVDSWISTANAQSETFLSFRSQPGDYIGGGQSLTFTPTESQFSSMVNQDNRELAVSVFSPGSFWFLNVAAPAGQQLVPGIYQGATRWPFQEPSTPGLDFSGDGRGCNTLTGQFQVLEAVYAPFGYVQRFHATFEQHCEGAEAALFGEIQIVNPPPPPPLTIDLKVDRKGAVQRVRGTATIQGTITCSQATTVQLSGTVTQRASRHALATGFFTLSTQCAPTPTPWSARVAATGAPFGAGPAQVDATATAYDPNFGVPVTVETSPLIRLSGGQR
ncbi:MAG: hypothetical protein ABIU05_20845 [Nitrospirales bacterium]